MCLKYLGKLTKSDYCIIKRKDFMLIIRRGGTFLPTLGHVRVNDARFKDVFFTDKESAHEILEEAYTRYAPATESKSPPQTRQRSDTTPEHGFWDYIAAKSGVKKPDTSVDAPTEKSAYLRKKPMSKDTDRSFDVLKEHMDISFPVLAQIARVYLSV